MSTEEPYATIGVGDVRLLARLIASDYSGLIIITDTDFVDTTPTNISSQESFYDYILSAKPEPIIIKHEYPDYQALQRWCVGAIKHRQLMTMKISINRKTRFGHRDRKVMKIKNWLKQQKRKYETR